MSSERERENLYIRRKRNKPVIFNTETEKNKQKRDATVNCGFLRPFFIGIKYVVDILTFIPLFILSISSYIFETNTHTLSLPVALFHFFFRLFVFLSSISYGISCSTPKLNVVIPLFFVQMMNFAIVLHQIFF